MKKRLFCLLMSIMMLCTIMPAVSVGADTTDVLPWKTLIATENFDYATGTTLTSGTLNGGTGFSGAWYRGAGNYDSSISENGAYKYLKCDGSTVTNNRILTDAIDTVNDGTYVVTFMLRESANETKQQNLKVGFTDSSNVSLDVAAPLFAGVCYDAANEKYCYQLSVNGETVLADVNYGFWSFWGKNMMLKVKIDVDADGIDTVSAKGWCPEKGDAEPNDWTMTVNSELSELNLNAVDYRIYGGASHLGALNIVKYNYDITYENATLEEYKNLANVTDEEELAERINVLAQNGFFYDDLKDYSGALQANTGLWNSGAGFSGAWFAQGSMDASVPGIVTAEDSSNFIKNYYASTHIKRDLAYPINTTKDGEYYLSFEMYDNGSPDEFPAINNKLAFTDKAATDTAQTLYAGVCLTEENEYRFQLGVGEDRVLSEEKFTTKEELLTKKIKFKVRLSIDEDAVDTVYMKAWMSGNAEPADWSCVKTAELSGYTLNQVTYTGNGTTSFFGKLYMEGYKADAVRELYSKIETVDADTLESVKAEVEEYIIGLAKEDILAKVNSISFEEEPVEPWKTTVVSENFDYATGTTLTSGTLNGGTGFSGAWYRGAGNYDSSISENGAYKYLKCDGSTVTNNRILTDAIDTVNDGTYVVTFMLRESANETKQQNLKVGFTDSSNVSLDVAAPLFAGVCYDAANEKYCYQLSVNGETVLADVNYGFWSFWGKNMMLKVKIDVDADGIDTVSAKGWCPEKGDAEPSGWTMTVNSELSELNLNAVDYRIYGGAAHLGNLEIVKYRERVDYANATLDEYNKLFEITDEAELADRLSALTEKGFFYDDLSSYSGALQANKDLWNSGAGFAGAWYGAGSMDVSVPGIVTSEDSSNFIKNYYKATPIKRDLAYAIDTTKDSEYYFAFEMYDTGTPDDFPPVDTKIGFADKSANAEQTLYAGISLAENEYHFQLGVGEDKALSEKKFIDYDDILRQIFKFKIRISIDSDGTDTVYMKAWNKEKDEPADWTCVINKELSSYKLNQLSFTHGGTTAFMGKVHMEGYESLALREMYSKIDGIEKDTYETVKAEVETFAEGIAKDDMLVKTLAKAPKELIGLSFNFKNADGRIIEKLTADMTSVSGEWIIKNTLGRDYNVMPLIAVYDKSTKKLEKVALVEGNTYPVTEGDEVTVSVTLDEISLSEGKIVRAFLWKADGSIAPLCKDASIDFSGSVIPEFDEAVRIFVDETATNDGNGDITAPF